LPRSSSYLAIFDLVSEPGVLMATEARRRGAEHIHQLTVLGAGAARELRPADIHRIQDATATTY
jgi:hypothetical protein